MAEFALMVAGTGVQAFSSLEAGKEAERSLDKVAAEEQRQAQVARAGILDEQRLVAEEGEAAKGASAARTAGKGLRAGGSARRQIESISRRVRRRQELLSKRASEIGLRTDIRSKELKRRGRRSRTAGRIGAFGSLLTGGAAIAKRSREAGGFGNLLRL